MARRLCALVTAVGLVVATARAEDVQVRLEYEAPEGCPSAAEFRREVEQRLQRGRIAGSQELLRTYRVSVTATEEGARARLEFTDVDGARARREVTGATCAEAATAMALVTALAIEARVADQQGREPPPPPSAAPVPPPPTAPPVRAVPPPSPVSRGASTTLGFGAAAGVERGFTPGIAPAVAAVLEVSRGAHALRASAQYSSAGPVEVDGGSATLWLLALRVEGCPARLPLGAVAHLVPCVAAEAGLLHAAGERSARIVHPESVDLPWLAAHAVGRLELTPDPRLALGVQGAAGVPFVRHELVLERPHAVVHEVPAVTWSAGVSVLGRFR